MTSLDFALKEAEVLRPLFQMNKYFAFLKKREDAIAAPFVITPKNLFLKCNHLYKDKLRHDNLTVFYCNYDQYIDVFVRTGAKLLTCTNCPFNNTK